MPLRGDWYDEEERSSSSPSIVEIPRRLSESCAVQSNAAFKKQFQELLLRLWNLTAWESGKWRRRSKAEWYVCHKKPKTSGFAYDRWRLRSCWLRWMDKGCRVSTLESGFEEKLMKPTRCRGVNSSRINYHHAKVQRTRPRFRVRFHSWLTAPAIATPPPPAIPQVGPGSRRRRTTPKNSSSVSRCWHSLFFSFEQN